MKSGNVNEFIDKTTYEECAVIYKGIKYFFHGLIFDREKNEYSYVIDVWDKNGDYGITLFKFDKHPDEAPLFYDEIYNVSHTDTTECIEAFLNAKLFDNYSIYDIESSIDILYS